VRTLAACLAPAALGPVAAFGLVRVWPVQPVLAPHRRVEIRPGNRGETAAPQRADVLAELGAATREGAANQAQGRLGLGTGLNPSGMKAGYVNADIVNEAKQEAKRSPSPPRMFQASPPRRPLK
jgi:hypothetical protein